MHMAHALRQLLALALLLGFLAMPGVKGYANAPFGNETQLTDYQAGVQAYRSGDYVRAVNYFRSILARDSGNTNAHYYLALSLDNLNLGEQAAREYQYVTRNGREEKIVAYAQTRLQALGSQPVKPALRENPAQEIAMVAAGSQLPSAAYRGAASQIAVPLKNNRNALMVDAVLTHEDSRAIGTFIIDTGATYTSISQEMAEQMGLDLQHCEKVYITTANGRIEVPKVVIDTLSVNGLEAHNVEATVIQVRRGSSFAGLLGLSFIRQFVLTIDPQAGQLIFQKN
jgi:clan AA aspartic protease (TIGR02281 family)